MEIFDREYNIIPQEHPEFLSIQDRLVKLGFSDKDQVQVNVEVEKAK